MNKRTKHITPLKEAIDKLLKAYKISDKLDEISIQQEWEKLMGSMIAKRTKSIALKNNILHVKLESSVLRHELNFAKARIVEKLNRQIGKRVVKDVLFY